MSKATPLVSSMCYSTVLFGIVPRSAGIVLGNEGYVEFQNPSRDWAHLPAARVHQIHSCPLRSVEHIQSGLWLQLKRKTSHASDWRQCPQGGLTVPFPQEDTEPQCSQYELKGLQRP